MGRKKDKKREKNFVDVLGGEKVPIPVIKGFTVQEISDITNTPYPTVSVSLDSMVSKGMASYSSVGRTKVYQLSNTHLKNIKSEDKYDKDENTTGIRRKKGK